jgi:peptidyl-prolyl cis-trans isomerase B (cyclophilin B)
MYALRLFQGRVLEGQELLASLTALPTNRNADEAGLFFAVAKSIGDKRATVAEKGFGRPLSKVQVAACGAA